MNKHLLCFKVNLRSEKILTTEFLSSEHPKWSPTKLRSCSHHMESTRQQFRSQRVFLTGTGICTAVNRHKIQVKITQQCMLNVIKVSNVDTWIVRNWLAWVGCLTLWSKFWKSIRLEMVDWCNFQEFLCRLLLLVEHEVSWTVEVTFVHTQRQTSYNDELQWARLSNHKY